MFHGAGSAIHGFPTPQHVEFSVKSSVHLIGSVFDLVVGHLHTICPVTLSTCPVTLSTEKLNLLYVVQFWDGQWLIWWLTRIGSLDLFRLSPYFCAEAKVAQTGYRIYGFIVQSRDRRE